jgi:uncharacterized membrane protein YukC
MDCPSVHSNHTLLYVIAWGDGEWKNELEWTKRLEGRDVLSMVNNNWRRKKRRRREEKMRKERKEEMDFIAWGKIE